MSDAESSTEKPIFSTEPIEDSGSLQQRLITCGSYRYDPLQSPHSIRILKLFPGRPMTDHDSLRGSLEEVSLDSSPEYEAVSYVWGTPDPIWPIFLQDSVLLIPRNAAIVLKRLRQPHSVFPLWIDAICINQNDIHERNAQVQLMRNIYGSATKVLIHIGEEFCQDSKTFDLLVTINRARKKLADALTDQDTTVLRTEQYEEVGLPVIDDEKWDLLPKALCLPWFSRVWVPQEAVVAQKPCFITQKGTLDMSVFIAVMDAIFVHNLPYQGRYHYPPTEERARISGARKFIMNIGHLRNAQRDGNRCSLISLLEENRDACATDPRDKMFALLGISKEADEIDLRPDYAEHLNNTYRRFARYFIERGQGSQVIFNAGYDETHEDLPTWIPRWASPGHEVFGALLTVDQSLTQAYNAHGQTQVSMHFGADETILKAKALLFDTVKGIGIVEVANKEPWEAAAACVEEVDQIWQVLGERYPTGETRDIVKCGTLLMNRQVACDEPAPKAYLVWYEAFKCVYAMCTAEPDSPAPSKASHGDVKDLLTALGRPFGEVHIDFVTSMGIEFGTTVLSRSQGLHRATTSKGFLCQVLPQVQVGDVIAVFHGCEVPYILRPREWNQSQLIGGCYVHGIMYGEALEMEGAKVETINLI